MTRSDSMADKAQDETVDFDRAMAAAGLSPPAHLRAGLVAGLRDLLQHVRVIRQATSPTAESAHTFAMERLFTKIDVDHG